MGIPQPSGLTLEQVASCNRFSEALWGEPMFTGPRCDGRHSWNCLLCSEVLRSEELSEPAPQPWEPKLRLVA